MTSPRPNHRLAALFCGLVGLLALACFVAAPAVAAPNLSVTLSHSPTTMPRNDEQLSYQIKVKNTGSSNPVVGDVLTCDANSIKWFNSPTFTFAWVRDANTNAPVSASSGGTTSTYTVQPGDSGHVLQCVVLGTNAGGAAGSFTRPVSVEPVPTSPAPPAFPPLVTENPRPTVVIANGTNNVAPAQAGVRICQLPSTWKGPASGSANTTSGSNQLTGVSADPFAVGQEIAAPSVPTGTTITAVGPGTLTLSANATATAAGVPVGAVSAGTGATTSGSNVITALTTAAGTGTTTSGSTSVTALNMTVGRWVIGLPVSGAGIPAGTTVTATSTNTLTLSQAATASGAGVSLRSVGPLPFAVGQEISAPGVPSGTTITSAGAETLTLSVSATATASGVALSAVTAGRWSFQWLRNGAPIGGATSAAHPVATTGTATTVSGSNQITGVTTATGRGTLASGSTTVTGVSAFTGGFLVGQTVVGTGVPAGTTIAAIAPNGDLTLSAAATSSGAEALAAGPQPFAVGQKINGVGIPANATITAISGQTVTFSGSPATITATGVSVAAGPDVATNLQCEVFGKTGDGGASSGGTALAMSSNSVVPTPSPTVPNNNGTESTPLPFIPSSSTTSGPITLEFELPAGEDVNLFSFSSAGLPATVWSCGGQPPAQPTKVVCQRSNEILPGQEAPVVTVLTSVGPASPDTLVAKAHASGGGASPGSAEDTFSFGPPTPFEITSFATKASDPLGSDYTQAGGHPASASATFTLPTHRLTSGLTVGVEEVRNVITDLPPGFVGSPKAVPQRCDSIAAVVEDKFASPTCPRASIVGSVDLESQVTGTVPHEWDGMALYNIKPDRGNPAQFGFVVKVNGFYTPISIKPRLRPEDGYAISIDAPQVAKSVVPRLVTIKLCSFGAQVQPGNALWDGAPAVVGCLKAGEAGANPIPFLTNPTSCTPDASVTKLSIDSWAHPGVFKSAKAIAPAVTGCKQVPFDPSVALRPTSHQADSPTGLDVSIAIPSEGLESPNGVAQAHLKRAVVTLPRGMAVNPAAADGLDACTQAQLGMSSGVPNDNPVNCPASSKVGSAEIVTPILDEHLTGSVYIAKQGDNPFGSLLSLYLVAESKERGILVKLPGKVAADPRTGQLVTTFDENPQAPVSSIDLHFNAGNRAPLLNPPKCGSYDIVSELSPWSATDPDNPIPAEIVKTTSTFEVTSGPNGGPCPNGNLEPKLHAGVTNPVAGSKSPFVLNLSREDGSQRFSALNVTMPPGLTGYLKGIPYCSDAALAGIPTGEGTGAGQLAAPACPAASQLGVVSVGAGGGSSPFYVKTGRAYLAGPYKGAPLSIAIVTPAVAGPFDLGNVVVRSAAFVDRQSAQITVKSDPIPTILHGILLDVRDIQVSIDRPNFILAPTNCEPMSVGAQVAGENGGNAAVSDRFQVGECAALGFKPKLSTRLFGGTKRGKNPRLRAIVNYTGNQANIKRVAVTLPHSEFLDQSHIRTICTRVQFAADTCPVGSIYGHARAFSPLVDYAVTGPVYLRSSSNPLPDLVMALRGPAHQPIEIDLVGRIDSVNGGIRTSFESVPDLPVSKFILDMKGGKKGLLINSRDICKSVNRSTVRMDGQNGKANDFRPVLANACGKKKARQKKQA